jgi:hypothetical protein
MYLQHRNIIPEERLLIVRVYKEGVIHPRMACQGNTASVAQGSEEMNYEYDSES